MRNTNKDEEQLIVDFIHGRLTEAEVILVNEKIRKDKDFANRLAFASALKIGTQKEGMLRTESKQKLLEKVRRKRRRKFIKMAILLLLSFGFILALAYFWKEKKQLPPIEKQALKIALKAQIKREYDINIAGTNSQKELSGPELIYHDSIEEGLTSMRDFLANSSENTAPIAFYYGATLLLYKNESSKAIQHLEKATGINSDYRQDAHFYLVIAYTLNDQLNNAKTVIENQAIILETLPKSIQMRLR